jgi:hypothetical protein
VVSETDRVKNEVGQRVKEENNISRKAKGRKSDWVGHILRRKFLLQQVIEENIKRGIEVTERRGRGRK